MSQNVYLKTACEYCSGHFEYPSKLTGQSIECPHCHQPTPLPPPVTPPLPSPLPQASLTVAEHSLKERPQPVDYGLTYDDLHLYDTSGWARTLRLDDGNVIQCLGTRPDDKYKEPKRWFLHRWQACVGKLVGLRASPSPGLIAYWQALHRYDKEKAAIEEAARKAARDAELRKRSYWTFLDGYAFERATAEVLNKHQFNAFVTPGSSDGGVDIEVTRNGLKGVVQCKAHMACVGPHVVRDLYGVIHHTRASFGIIVSLGGFTKGAVEFARDKPILFVDLDDLIAMQEGKDVLAAAFSSSSSGTKS